MSIFQTYKMKSLIFFAHLNNVVTYVLSKNH